MQRLSSNATLFFRLFLPVFWTVFFGLFTIAIWTKEIPYSAHRPMIWLKAGTTFFYVAGLILLYFTLFRLRRIDVDEHYLYASDYFRTYRYTFDSIKKITEWNLGFTHVVHIHLRAKGRLGRRLSFLLDASMLKDWLEKNPEKAALWAKFCE